MGKIGTVTHGSEAISEVLMDVRNQLERRLKELEPYVAEHSQIEAALELLTERPRVESDAEARAWRGAGGAWREDAHAGRGHTTQADATSRKPRRRRQQGGRRAQLLDLIRKNPGITMASAARQMGVKPTNLYRVAAQLQADGTIEKNGPNYSMPTE